jgi:protein TonB
MSYAYPRTANDRLKDGFELRLALSFMAAVVLHTLVFKLWPAVQVESWGIVHDGVMEVIPVEEYDLPTDPTPIPRPARPVPTNALAEVVEVLPVFNWRQVAELPPPRAADQAQTLANGIPFTPYQVEPSLLNPAEVQRVLEREYPAVLRDAGIGGTVSLLVHIDAQGNVLEARVGSTSGMGSLDEAALRVADVFRFRPALNRDRAVEVWIRLPVTFQVR